VQQIEAELDSKDREMEMLEREHRVHIKVHEQKVQSLEYEHKETKRQVQESSEMSVQQEREIHTETVLDMNAVKLHLKGELKKQQLGNQEDVNSMQQVFARGLHKTREQFEHQHRQLQERYDKQVEQLKIDLELSQKVEIHEIEERKNLHINELLLHHQEAFDEIKAYYNDITHDNLQLIKALKDDIHEMKEREKKNKRKMDAFTQENKDLNEPLMDRRLEQQQLEDKLRSYPKDKMALKNLRAHCKKLEERTSEAKAEYHTTESHLRKKEKERDDLYRRFQKAVQEIRRKAELGKNAVLEQKLEVLAAQFEQNQAQLTEALAAANLDPTVVGNVTRKLEEVLGTKNRQIKDLQYQVHQCTKAYNDTIHVYENKLPSLGIDPEEIGFEPLQTTTTSNMPARLVTKIV